ncbi:unnamed protein product [Paramecium sonneborni]|uniref:Uncharacterized protein n=1 Tax=Paramecium sonneborni TaxID=65129 RepID=A0A8S1RD36_9CILI|nr:unnamed protein product [Paramecium sonneborni]
MEYYAAGTDQVQYTFYFDFTVTIERASGAPVETAFRPLSYQSTVGCTTVEKCIAKADTKINFCQDPSACTNFASTPLDLHLNDQFIIQQKVTTTGLTGYHLTGTEVWYTGNGLNKKANIVNLDNLKPGAVNITLQAEIAWRNVTIKVTSILGNTQNGGKRLLAQTTYDTITGETNIIECIKAERQDTCGMCEEECLANGFARSDCSCEYCCSAQQTAFIFLALFIALFFALKY